MIRALLNRLIQRVRHDPAYALDPRLGAGDVAREVAFRGLALVRAQWKLRRVPGGRLRFVERGCTIRHRRHLSVGTGSVIEAGANLRCLSREGVRLGRRVTVGKHAMVECTGVLWHLGRGLSVGDDSSIGDFCFVGCGGGVRIGSNVLMGQRVSFHSQNHNFDDPSVPIRAQGVSERGIVVGDDCWIGAGSVLLDGVVVGDGCVVAAGAVVTESFPPLSVIAGVPARRVRARGDQDRPAVGEEERARVHAPGP